MLTANLLATKRDGGELTDDEIRFLVEGFCDGEVADYQMSAFAMAICVRGMSSRETATLTQCMLESGTRLPRVTDRPRVDKHSTGGLGDKVSLILAPLLAACGVDVPMISGRGLGRTGGTLDKLEAIPGFRTNLSITESSDVLREAGAFIVGASERIAPADRRLYSLRDVTGTVESIPLITASILSKKLAASLDALVMDVKVGSAAFMKTLPDAAELARSLVRVGGQAGLPTSALITDMDQPLGTAVGNAIEVNESIELLRAEGPRELRELVLDLAGSVLAQVKFASSPREALALAADRLDAGHAMERFERMVAAQGGRLDGPLPLAHPTVVEANRGGTVAAIRNEVFADAILDQGGGRRRVGDSIDPKIGIAMHVRIGDSVQVGQPLFTLHFPETKVDNFIEPLRNAVQLTESEVDPRPLIIDRFPADASSTPA